MKQALIFNLCSSSNISNDFSVGSKIESTNVTCVSAVTAHHTVTPHPTTHLAWKTVKRHVFLAICPENTAKLSP